MSIDIETSRAICDAATPGPWKQSKYGLTEHIHIEYGPHAIATAARKEDRAFVLHARTALPAALDEIERLRAFRASLVAWMESYEDEAQSFLASSGLAPHVHAFHRGRVKAMEDLICFLDAPGGEG